MAHIEFNRATIGYTKPDSTVLWAQKPMTSLSLEGGDRPEVIINTSTYRKSSAGLPTPRRLTVGMILDDPDLSDLVDAIDECDSGAMVITVYDCGTPAQFLSVDVWIMNYDITAEMDGVYQVSIDFLVDERS